MSKHKLIQAIITNDFRVFLSGAEALIERYALSDHFGDTLLTGLNCQAKLYHYHSQLYKSEDLYITVGV